MPNRNILSDDFNRYDQIDFFCYCAAASSSLEQGQICKKLGFAFFWQNSFRGNCSYSEAVVWKYSVKKVLLEILQNSHENTCARVSILIKLQASE